MACRVSGDSSVSFNSASDQGIAGNVFTKGQKLHPYQADDLVKLLRREQGEWVCNGEAHNDTGYLVAYPMGSVSSTRQPM